MYSPLRLYAWARINGSLSDATQRRKYSNTDESSGKQIAHSNISSVFISSKFSIIDSTSLFQVLNNIKVYLQEEEKRMIKQDEECE